MLSEREKEILLLLSSKQLTFKEIMEKLNLKRSRTYDLLRDLKNRGLITKDGDRYALTDKGKQVVFCSEGLVRAHNTKIVLYAPENSAVRQDIENIISKSSKKADLKNWEAHYIDLSKYGLEDTVQINLADKITVVIHLKEFYFNTLDEAVLKVQNQVEQIRKALKLEGIITSPEWIDFDWGKIKIPSEYAVPLDKLGLDNLPLTPGVEVEFDWNAKDLKGQDLGFKSSAWIDKSKGRPEVEARDAEYITRKFLQMPVVVEDIQKTLKENDEFFKNLGKAAEALAQAGENFAENINSHIPYVQNAALALNKITEVIQLQQQQQQMFLHAMENQNKMIELLSNRLTQNGNRTSVLVPFVVFVLLLLIAVVKGGLL